MHNDPPATINANDALDQPDLPPQYLPISRLGQGGMGEVWKVEQRNDNKFVRYVAAKLLPRDSINYDAFERELNTAVRFQHPRILPIHDFGKTLSGRPFIIMQLAQQSLAARLSAGTIDTETLLRWLGQIAEALDHVHGAGYLHRDVKPANILLDQGDAFLADFGIAELVGSETSLSGTQAYMSPEQAAGSTLDARADVFALAVTACECLSGKRTRRPDELIASKGIRPAMVAVLQAALDLDPAKRPGRASLFIEQLVRASRRGRNLYNVSPLPPQFVARETQMAELRAALLNRKPDHRIALTAIDGAGGIGKSMLSLALCHDSAVQDAYSDGIFWVDIGKKPSPIVEKLRAIGMAFHDTPAYYQSEDTAKTRLDELLADKAILIILDDVWDADYIKPFQFASPRSCTLFSTRNRRFYKKVGAVEVAVPPPTLSEAIAMLKHYAERDDASFTAIAERMGRLPLALKLIGARLKEQPTLTGSEWLARFQHVTELKEGYNSNRRDDNLAVCLELSVDALDEQAKPLYYALGIFPEDVWVPQAVISRLWREQNPALSENDAIGLALELEALALIDRRAGDDTLILHDLLHDYNREKLDNRLISTHAALLHAYNPMSKPWPEVPHDGYLYFQLAYHLRETGRKEALYELLTDSRAWMDAKFAACSDHTAYMADLDLALTDFVEPFFADDLIRVVQFHGARQVVSAQVDIYQDIDLQTLVWLGKGTEALAHARMRTQLQKRVSGLLGIIKICVECHQPADDLYEEALINSEQILSAADRANAQSAIAAALAQAGDNRARTTFAQALDSAAAIEDAGYRAIAQSAIAAALAQAGDSRAQTTFTQALDSAAALEDAEFRANAQSAIAAALAQAGQFAQALDSAAAIEDAYYRASAQSAIAAALAQAGDNRARTTFAQALDSAAAIEHAYYRASAQCAIAAALAQAGDSRAQTTFTQALDSAAALEDAEFRANAQSAIAAALAQAGQFAQALDSAAAIEDAYYRASAQSAIAAALAQAGQFVQALDSATAIEDASERASAQSAIAAALVQAGDSRAQTTFAQALDSAAALEDAFVRATAQSAITAALAQAGQFAQALDSAAAIEDAEFRASAQSAIVTTLAQAKQFAQALDSAAAIEVAYSRARAQSDIAAALTLARDNRAQTTFAQALSSAAAIEVAYFRARVQSDFAAAFAQAGDSRAQTTFAQALDSAAAIEDAEFRARAQSAIAAALAQAGDSRAQTTFVQALDSAAAIETAFPRASVQSDFAAALAQAGQFAQALDSAVAIENAEFRARAQSAIAAALAQAGDSRAQATFAQALDSAVAIEGDFSRASAQSALAAALTQAGEFAQALDSAVAIENAEFRASAQSDIATALAQAGDSRAQTTFAQALDSAVAIEDAYFRARAQSAIAAALAQAGDSRAQTTFAQALDSAAALEDASSLAQSDIAAALVAVGKLQQAFQVLGNQSFPAYMQFLSALAPAAEKIEPGLFARVVYEAARILSWQRKTWEPLRNALKPAVDETAKPTVSPAPPSNVLAVAMQSSVRKLRRESLLIGIGNYVWQSYLPSLASVAPAQEVLQTCMSAVGWRLRSLADTQSPTSEYFPTLDNLIAEIEGLPSGIDLLWLHFCGYADVFSNEPYLFVQDSTELNKTRRALSLIDLRRMLQKVAPQSALVTLDTYPPHRDDGATEIAKDEFLSAAKDALRGMAVIAGRTWSGTARSLSGQPMSVFTSFLADALSDPAAQLGGALTVGQLADYMRNMLSEWRADHPGTILRPVFQVEGFENLVLADQRLAE